MNLHDVFIYGLSKNPAAIALHDLWGVITYQQLEDLICQFMHVLKTKKVNPGDRVGIWLTKSRYAVAAMQAVLRLGASYVPLDSKSPLERISLIAHDCELKLLVTNRKAVENAKLNSINILYLKDELYNILPLQHESVKIEPIRSQPQDLAYILYTSGSTGKPKGVCISHQNALAFIEWAVETIKPKQNDRFIGHAAFHFDLSVFDLYVSFYVGASVYLVTENIAFLPSSLIKFIDQNQITILYTVPVVLLLLMQEGELMKSTNLKLHTIIFAGEVFPIKHFQKLYQSQPYINYYNFYGPTETNVCMYYNCNELQNDFHSIPIGFAASGNKFFIVSTDKCSPETGELIIQGPSVMLGYWGEPWLKESTYATGDMVRVLSNGAVEYLGRSDNMIKRSGYRIELEEIEKILLTHKQIEQAVAMIIGEGLESKLIAYIVSSKEKPNLLSVKAHCALYLPNYMIVDSIRFIDELPKNANGKLDRLSLRKLEESLHEIQ